MEVIVQLQGNGFYLADGQISILRLAFRADEHFWSFGAVNVLFLFNITGLRDVLSISAGNIVASGPQIAYGLE